MRSVYILGLIFEIYFFYQYQLSALRIQQGELFMKWGHAAKAPFPFAAYIFVFFVVFIVSTVGLLVRRRWAYYVFNIWGIPALLGLGMEIVISFRDNAGIPVVEMLAFLALAVGLVVLNMKKELLIEKYRRVGMMEVVIVVGGVLLNIVFFVLTMNSF